MIGLDASCLVPGWLYLGGVLGFLAGIWCVRSERRRDRQ